HADSPRGGPGRVPCRGGAGPVQLSHAVRLLCVGGAVAPPVAWRDARAPIRQAGKPGDRGPEAKGLIPGAAPAGAANPAANAAPWDGPLPKAARSRCLKEVACGRSGALNQPLSFEERKWSCPRNPSPEPIRPPPAADLKGWKIALLHNARPLNGTEGQPDDLFEEYDSGETIASIRDALQELVGKVVPVAADRSLPRRLAEGRFQFAFNIAEGTGRRCREAIPAA